MMTKPVILTGIRANNDLHLGNYAGAMLPMVDMAGKQAGDYQFNFFVPDLHSFTTPIDHDSLYGQTLATVRMYAAAGLPMDHGDVHVYRQSRVPAHSELTWILSCFTYFGEMSRMTQFKDKSQKTGGDNASVGLFAYPILMAADILLYGAEYVPVGDDQTQHLEFTRDIADRMNNQFGQLFTLPKPVKEQHQFFGTEQGLRIRNLIDPTRKMDKSDETGKGVIFLSDPPETARKKITGATTDSLGEIGYDYSRRPGISNLLDLLWLFGGDPEEFKGATQYGPLKQAVGEKVADFLADFQSRLEQTDDETIKNVLADSEAAADETARQRLHQVQQAVGLRDN
ncbi:tryptophan--tRNA ligase [Candidatus Saccharibacteria bacterium QS_5_54_17]|nr:MAG: tryptophan--tRNA ligase [Candidatus Saccharibacteria bacterium QS_5_54_17]